MQRRHLLQLAALGALPSSLSLASTAWAQAKDAIQFGCPVPMSGPFAANGKFADLGMKLAIEQYGKALGRPLAYTLLMYYLLKKNYSPVKLILFTIVVGLAGKGIGIF